MLLTAITQSGGGGLDAVLQGVPGWTVEWIRAVNARLDVSLAGTMAGLSFAAGGLVAGAAGAMESSHATIRANKGIVDKTAQARLDRLRTAASASFTSFYAFVIFVIAELTADAGLAASQAPSHLVWQDGAMLLTSGAAGGWGLFQLVRAAGLLRKNM
ncbi:MAG: hypothetical protein HBSAPP03_17300 [Phycisphaerae bacterium]|nr:MAG: hypothetical protein HBSAPP03_17300 [Phycisphaerae bacterium]